MAVQGEKNEPPRVLSADVTSGAITRTRSNQKVEQGSDDICVLQILTTMICARQTRHPASSIGIGATHATKQCGRPTISLMSGVPRHGYYVDVN